MTHTHKIFRMKNLVMVLALLSITLMAKSYWIDSQKLQIQDDFHTKAFAMEPEVKDTSNEIDILKTEIKNNRESLAKLSQHIGAQFAELQSKISQWTGKLETMDNSKQEDESLNTMTGKDEEEKIKTDTNNQIELLENSLQDRESDPTWSMDAKQLIYEAFSTGDVEGISLNNAVCGSKLCRVNLSLDGTKKPGEAYRDLIDLSPWQGQGFIKIDEESGEVELYLAKEGHGLPKVEEEENTF